MRISSVGPVCPTHSLRARGDGFSLVPRAHYGESLGSGAGAAAVPEPSTFLLTTIALF